MTTTTQIERPGAITFKGNPVTLVGPELHVGDHAPDFQLMTTDLKPVNFSELSDGGRRAVLMILIPSIDTSVCALETGKFNRHLGSLSADKIKAVTISADTPFAQRRWAVQEGVNNLQMLSDHKDRAFADAYGVYIKELGLLTRAIYLVDKDGIIRYIQTLPEVAMEPDYDAVLRAARELISD
jgi:thiol peroxidase